MGIRQAKGNIWLPRTSAQMHATYSPVRLYFAEGFDNWIEKMA